MIMVEWGTALKATLFFYFRNALCSTAKIFTIDFFQTFIFFTEGSCEYVKNDHVLLNIATVTGKWFRKFVFNFNLTGVYSFNCSNRILLMNTLPMHNAALKNSVFNIVRRSNRPPIETLHLTARCPS